MPLSHLIRMPAMPAHHPLPSEDRKAWPDDAVIAGFNSVWPSWKWFSSDQMGGYK